MTDDQFDRIIAALDQIIALLSKGSSEQVATRRAKLEGGPRDGMFVNIPENEASPIYDASDGDSSIFYAFHRQEGDLLVYVYDP